MVQCIGCFEGLQRFAMGRERKQVEIVVIGCGLPEKSMGWYHAWQLIQEFSHQCTLTGIVEPWYLGSGRDAPGSEAFKAFQADCHQRVPGKVEWVDSVDKLAPRPLSPGSAAIALVACRTPDMPQLARQALAKGFTHVYLEKPGSPSVADLDLILTDAEALQIPVFMGYNKNCSAYVVGAVQQVRKWQAERKPPSFTVILEHNNAFKLPEEGPDLVNFVSGPGCEGIVHNMLCHEFAFAHTFFGLSVSTLERVELLPGTIKLPLADRIDFQCLAFRCYLRDGMQLDIVANRCGGNCSSIHLDREGYPRMTFTTPDGHHAKWVVEQQQLRPNIMPYFLLQEPDYRELKRRALEHVSSGRAGVPAGLVDLRGAREVLMLADYLAPKLRSLASAQL